MHNQLLLFQGDLFEVQRILHGNKQWLDFVMMLWANPELSPTQAAVKVGYSNASARTQSCKLMEKAPIKKALSLLRQHQANDAKITREEWMRLQMKVLHRCMEQELVRDQEGQAIGKFSFNANGANKALDNIAKVQHFYEVEPPAAMVFHYRQYMGGKEK